MALFRGSFCLGTMLLSVYCRGPVVPVAEDIEHVAKRSTTNRDIRYDVWQNPQRILFRLDTNYNESQVLAINGAMNQITSDMSSCIRFAPFNVVTDSREDHIFISPLLNTGVPATTCTTFPGRLVRQNGQGQKLMVSAGPGGCMADKRDIMAVLVPVLGLRSEYKRPDRDDFIQVFPSNVLDQFQSLNILRIYNTSQVEFRSSAFDMKSVTIPSPTRFAKPTTVVYTPRERAQSFGNLPRLSLGDCQALRRLYPTCSSVICSDPYVDATGDAIINAAVIATTTQSTPLPSGLNNAISAAVNNAVLQAMQAAAGNSGSGAVITLTTTRAPRGITALTPPTGPIAPVDLMQPVDPPSGGFEFFLNPARKEKEIP